MPELELSEQELHRAVELAEGYLEEAENVLWTATTNADSVEYKSQLEDATRDLWEIQHKLRDIQRQFDELEKEE